MLTKHEENKKESKLDLDNTHIRGLPVYELTKVLSAIPSSISWVNLDENSNQNRFGLFGNSSAHNSSNNSPVKEGDQHHVPTL